ncbi:acetate--CoA ligase [Candidatus Woesearchaeota archaeon B3_Woes]|nr:MAG: acetate--CoA ligase [Candidatus Woesearchaeota archaeon B3_Woes]
MPKNSNTKNKFYPPKEFQKKAHINNLKEYQKIYKESISNPEKFWAEKAEQLDWFKKWNIIFKYTKKPFMKWFEGGKLNVSYNCLDRHLTTKRKNKPAIIWQGESEKDKRIITYQQLHKEVCKFANVLKKKGIKKGDRIIMYMPMIPELAISMLACTRIGAIHSVVFCGFSASALQSRIKDCKAKMLITSDGNIRKGKALNVKETVDEALKGIKTIKSVIICKRAKNKIKIKKGRDFWWHDEINAKDISNKCEPRPMNAEDPLFILYTSGTTGKPKGLIHTTAGYLLYTYQTFKWIFDIKEKDVYWCTADIGWITGHSYIVYGPLANGATTVMYEGVITYPDPGRAWKIVEKFKVNIFYTAPTLIRSLTREGDKWPKKYNLNSLRLLGSVGEPINPDSWLWYYNVIGKKKCPIVDTWWQTETGGILISPLPGLNPLKPGSATKPFPGIQAEIYKENGKKAKPNKSGYLIIKKPWPGLARTIWGDSKRYKETYFSKFKEIYLTGDEAKKDKEGYFWIMGRLDDVINVSGHRLGTAEIESAIVTHNKVAESAVVPFPCPIKGQGIYAFVTLKKGVKKSKDLKKEIIQQVRKEIGPIAKPDKIQFADALPKTRSGKIMRRILKAIAEGKEDVGNTTTLADPSVVEILKQEKQNTH